MSQALVIAVLGMGFVLFFLFLLICVLNILRILISSETADMSKIALAIAVAKNQE